MLVIKNAVSNIIIIKNSKFIAYLYKVDNEKQINILLKNLQQEYKDANHHCFAYIIDNIKRFNDAGEPSGTAGLPILNVLEKNNLNYILCVVIRYFGGIKLGAGGLVRAYTKATTEALNKTTVLEYNKSYKVKIEFSLNNMKIVDNILKNIKIDNKLFTDKVIYEFVIEAKEEIMLEQLKKIVNNMETHSLTN